MGPDEIEQMMDQVPFVPFRMSLSSGDLIEIRQREGLSIIGLSLAIYDVSAIGSPRLRFVSIPNVAMVTPLPPATSSNPRREDGE